MQANIIEAVNDALHTEMADDDRVVVFGEDVAQTGGVFRATEGLLEAFRDDRVLDTPISEVAIAGLATGLGMYGYRPVAEIQFSGFLPIAFDQLVTHTNRIRWRTRGKHSTPLVVRAPYGAGIRPLEHHSESHEAVYSHIPGLKVVVPSTPYDTKGLLISAIRDPDPVLFFEPKRIYRTFQEEVPDEAYEVPIGDATIRTEGSDITVIAWGSMLQRTLKAVEGLDQSIDVEVVDLRTISPLDKETVIESVKKTGRVVVVHEAPKTGGFGAEITATINDEALMYLEAPVNRVTGFDTPIPLFAMEDYYLPTEPEIEQAIIDTVSYE